MDLLTNLSDTEDERSSVESGVLHDRMLKDPSATFDVIGTLRSTLLTFGPISIGPVPSVEPIPQILEVHYNIPGDQIGSQ